MLRRTLPLWFVSLFLALLAGHKGAHARDWSTVVVTKADGTRARYAVGQRLGSGGWADVYAGHDLATGQKVALKILNIQYQAGRVHGQPVLQYEHQVLSALEKAQAGLPRSFGFGATDDAAARPTLVMELVPGTSLGPNWRAADRARPVGKAVRVVIKLAEDVERMHQAGWSHNDIHPGNVKIDNDRSATARLVDVGLVGPYRPGGRDPDLESKGYLGLARLGLALLTGGRTNDPQPLASLSLTQGVGRDLAAVMSRALSGGYASAGDFARALAPFRNL